MNIVPDPEQESALKLAAEIIRGSYTLSAFTGAGMSVESGIPPFRGDGGLWDRYDPRLLDLDYFLANPEPCWRTIKEIFYDHFGKAAPNAGHLVLADMEKDGILRNLITQNIDDLHYRAGSRKVVEFHGNSRRLLCLSCERNYEAASFDLTAMPPKCPKCGGLLKPDVVFFGEAIPVKALEASQRIARETDCMIVIGTTGEVYPAAALPQTAHSRGARIIEINPSPSNYTDNITEVRIGLPAGQALPLLWEAVKKRA